MINFDYFTKEDIKKKNLNWQEIPYHSYQILITNASLNLINHKPDIDEIYAKDPYEAKYQLLIKKEKVQD